MHFHSDTAGKFWPVPVTYFLLDFLRFCLFRRSFPIFTPPSSSSNHSLHLVQLHLPYRTYHPNIATLHHTSPTSTFLTTPPLLSQHAFQVGRSIRASYASIHHQACRCQAVPRSLRRRCSSHRSRQQCKRLQVCAALFWRIIDFLRVDFVEIELTCLLTVKSSTNSRESQSNS